MNNCSICACICNCIGHAEPGLRNKSDLKSGGFTPGGKRESGGVRGGGGDNLNVMFTVLYNQGELPYKSDTDACQKFSEWYLQGTRIQHKIMRACIKLILTPIDVLNEC